MPSYGLRNRSCAWQSTMGSREVSVVRFGRWIRLGSLGMGFGRCSMAWPMSEIRWSISGTTRRRSRQVQQSTTSTLGQPSCGCCDRTNGHIRQERLTPPPPRPMLVLMISPPHLLEQARGRARHRVTGVSCGDATRVVCVGSGSPGIMAKVRSGVGSAFLQSGSRHPRSSCAVAPVPWSHPTHRRY